MDIYSDDGKMATNHSNHTQTVEEFPRSGKGQETNKVTQGSKSVSSEAVQETLFSNDSLVHNFTVSSISNRDFLVNAGVTKKTEVRVHF